MSKSLIKSLVIAVVLTISATLLFIWGCSSYKHNPCEYQFIVTDDSLTVYDGDRTVGTVKIQGQLDSLIIEDNK